MRGPLPSTACDLGRGTSRSLLIELPLPHALLGSVSNTSCNFPSSWECVETAPPVKRTVSFHFPRLGARTLQGLAAGPTGGSCLLIQHVDVCVALAEHTS